MPLQKLQFTPGVNRESTSLANEGGWFECDKVRFRSGFPEKIGEWVLDNVQYGGTLQPSTGSFWGVCRLLCNHMTLANRNVLGIGTNLKFQLQDGLGGFIYDVTPLRTTTAAGAVTFAASNGSSQITATHTLHGASAGDFVTFSGATSLGGTVTASILNAEHQITSATANTYTFTVSTTANSSDTGNGGAAVVGAYQLNTGPETTSSFYGWGAGGWGGVTAGESDTAWGESASSAVQRESLLWSAAPYGENLIINPRQGALYMWVPNPTPAVYDRAVKLASTSSGVYQTDANCPSVCTFVTVAPEARIVVAYGVNDYGESTRDPLLIRWSAQEDYAVWTPAATNQAGSYRLTRGSAIITTVQTRQETIVFTDAALYSQKYAGPPWVFQFEPVGDNISIAAPNVAVTANNVVYWMGVDKFYTYSGRVETLPCTLRQYVFGDINRLQAPQFFATTNEAFNEVWWFYCSANSDTIDRYVIYNHLERIWTYGTLSRTAWLDTPLRDAPVATGYDGKLISHEVGVDDGETNPVSAIEAYIQSADFNIGDGHNYGFVWRMIPDVTFDGSSSAAPQVTITVRPRRNPGANYGTADAPVVTSVNDYAGQRNYTVQQFTQIVYTRLRGRQMAVKISSDTVGTQWQLGVPAIDIRPDGRR